MHDMTQYHAGRHFLQIPGPTNVPDRVLRAIDNPTIDHRGPAFGQLGLEILTNLRAIFQTTGPVVIYPASGTGAWEAALTAAAMPLMRRFTRSSRLVWSCRRRLPMSPAQWRSRERRVCPFWRAAAAPANAGRR